MGKTHCFTAFKMRLHLRWCTTIFSQLPHMRTTISPDFWIVYIPVNTSTFIRTLKKAKKSLKIHVSFLQNAPNIKNFHTCEKVVNTLRRKSQKGKNGQNALFHLLLQNAPPTPALIYHDFLFHQLPHMRTTISPDSLWIVYIKTHGEHTCLHFHSTHAQH